MINKEGYYNSEARLISFTERSEVGTEGDSTEGER